MSKKLSGAIGIVKLSKKYGNNMKKEIYVFSDNHNNNIYCSKNFNKSYNIIDFIKKHKDDQILLEEIDKEQIKKGNYNFLWNVPHSKELQKLYRNTTFINPTDIRNRYIDYTLDIENIDNTFIDSYAYKLDNFFLKKKFNLDNLYKLLKSRIYKTSGIAKHYYFLRNKYIKERKKFKNDNITIDMINYYLDSIMEWYTIILILSSPKKTILHTGLLHSSNIIDLLVKIYKYDIYYKDGINNINQFNMDSASCINI